MEQSTEPYAVEAKTPIQEKVGDVPGGQLFPPEKIEACQEVINDKTQDFMQNAQACIATLDADCKQIQVSPDMSELSMRRIAQTSQQLKSLTETLGLSFAYEVAALLHKFIDQAKKPNNYTPVVISKHLDVLRLSLKEKNQPLAKEIVGSLSELIKKRGLAANPA